MWPWAMNGRVNWLGTKGVRYDIGPTLQPQTCNKGLPAGCSTYQIPWPSNGLMQNCYSFLPMGPLMGSQFSELWPEGCCCSLDVLLQIFLIFPCSVEALQIATIASSSSSLYIYDMLHISMPLYMCIWNWHSVFRSSMVTFDGHICQQKMQQKCCLLVAKNLSIN